MNTRQRRTRTVQDDKIFHPAKLVQTYSKKQELRRRKTHRSIEMTSTHTPCKLINQRGSCKIHDKCKPWCANKENYITQQATEPSKYHQLVKICQAKNPELFSQPGIEQKSWKDAWARNPKSFQAWMRVRGLISQHSNLSWVVFMAWMRAR
jgi:hypothetical protein